MLTFTVCNVEERRPNAHTRGHLQLFMRRANVLQSAAPHRGIEFQKPELLIPCHSDEGEG